MDVLAVLRCSSFVYAGKRNLAYNLADLIFNVCYIKNESGLIIRSSIGGNITAKCEFGLDFAAQAAVGDGPKYKVVVTGDLNHWDRDAFKDYIETLGHKMVGSISGKTDFLITNTPNSGTVKNRKAQELGVRIITETEAIEILGLTVPNGREVVAPGSGTETSAGFRQVSLEDL